MQSEMGTTGNSWNGGEVVLRMGDGQGEGLMYEDLRTTYTMMAISSFLEIIRIYKSKFLSKTYN